jgi:hypothetical protein
MPFEKAAFEQFCRLMMANLFMKMNCRPRESNINAHHYRRMRRHDRVTLRIACRCFQLHMSSFRPELH